MSPMAFHGNTRWHPDDTIVAISSAVGPGRRGIIRLSGSLTFPIVDQLITTEVPRRAGYLAPGRIRVPELFSPLPVDVYSWIKPHSYTGQDLAELHTIGCAPLLEAIVAHCLQHGARLAQPGEFTLRAFLNGKKDLTQAEAVLGVIDARTEEDLHTSLDQLAGNVRHPLAQLRDDLLNLLADVEAALDFAEEDIQFVSESDLLRRISAGIAHLVNLQRQLNRRSVSGLSLQVAIVGRPNAGKSSLFNALLGRAAAIVSDEAGTTRDYLTATVNWGGLEVTLIDTAGWQQATNAIEEQAQRFGQSEAKRADLMLWCVPADEAISPTDAASWGRFPGLKMVRTKADRVASDCGAWSCSVMQPGSVERFRGVLIAELQRITKTSLAQSQSRCQGHVSVALQALQRAYAHVLEQDPPELLALALREALEQLGQLTGAIYTNDLLDRIFSRFCIGK